MLFRTAETCQGGPVGTGENDAGRAGSPQGGDALAGAKFFARIILFYFHNNTLRGALLPFYRWDLGRAGSLSKCTEHVGAETPGLCDQGPHAQPAPLCLVSTTPQPCQGLITGDSVWGVTGLPRGTACARPVPRAPCPSSHTGCWRLSSPGPDAAPTWLLSYLPVSSNRLLTFLSRLSLLTAPVSLAGLHPTEGF